MSVMKIAFCAVATLAISACSTTGNNGTGSGSTGTSFCIAERDDRNRHEPGPRFKHVRYNRHEHDRDGLGYIGHFRNDVRHRRDYDAALSS